MVKRKTSALEKIESHEKLCRIMQKQTFQKMEALEQRIGRIEKWIIGGMFAILLAVLSNHF
jgi:aconitase B